MKIQMDYNIYSFKNNNFSNKDVRKYILLDAVAIYCDITTGNHLYLKLF